jgi:hypothetical protein
LAALSLQQRQRSDINMSSSNWRDGEIRELLTIMGEKGMKLRLMKTGKEKVPEKLSYKTFVWIKSWLAK